MQRSSAPPLALIRPPEDLTDKIGADELAVFEPLWTAHLVQCLAHWLAHSHPRSEDEALRCLETFFSGSPLIFRRAAARLYVLNLNPL